jgi:dynein heavy chain
LKFATPATVSRAGILFISDTAGSQWRSYVKSWIKSLKFDDEKKQSLQQNFDKYIPDTLFYCAKSFKHVVPQVEISMVMSMCKLIENIMNHQNSKGIEYIFVFACIWCIGGGYIEKEGKDYRREFDKWWKSKWTTIKFPSKGTVFDYFIDTENVKLELWSNMQTADIVSTIDTSKSIASYTIPTPDTIAASYLMNQFIQINHSPILVGLAGCGKTQIIKGLLNELVGNEKEDYLQQIVNMNYYTDANLLRSILEKDLIKKAGRTYEPPGKSKLIYFVDDINMPKEDPYETQTAIALLRQ